MKAVKVLWGTQLDMWCVELIIMHAFSYPSRSTMCKDRIPWVPLLRVSFIRSYRLLHITHLSGKPDSLHPLARLFFEIESYIYSSSSPRCGGHVGMPLFEQAATVKTLLSETTSNQSGCGTSWTPRSWNKVSTVNQHLKTLGGAPNLLQ